MIPVTGYEGRVVGVLGLGRSGLAAARALEAGGARVLCWDDGEAARTRAEAQFFEIADLSRDGAWEAGLALLVVSPGIPALYPAPHPAVEQARARGVPVDNDVGLLFRALAASDFDDFDTPPRVVCVTGSNGKSTTTALIGHILETAHVPCQVGGNIGKGVLALDPIHDGDVLVLELSSYQIETARSLAPDVAVFLNLSDDHLDRHGGRGGYFAAKARLFELGAPERAVIGLDEPEGRALADRLRGRGMEGESPVVAISASRKLPDHEPAVTARKGFLAERRGGRQTASADLREMETLKGAHNHQNACAAWAACRALGLAPKVIEAGMRTFPGLAHRMERVAEREGVSFVNDSKATNADAAEKALLSYDRIRWIAGGVPKAGGIESLRPLFDRVACAYLIGEAAEDFAQTLGEIPHEFCGDLDSAVERAWAASGAGETILLSPACASFDQYPNFEARGDAFRARARRIAGLPEEDAPEAEAGAGPASETGSDQETTP
ncbi:UDP-N-acetylmuramoylalanine--D-glutamate ligase [Albimonas donghaensis]|uniref:UDP-N-acetylmuramoylalanine--D-glutamate ligase n=1 Tax=Albimonas donghaensis TaxID=356660 RepID=A0A1H3EM98_9RHOB|nr:UDP-N-acetylmuramoyl-L-alanine--D-glutamate ligase [Albimonas donghaensis]SDX79084.1 UDP-N-acetylmuramoylalanine--D-glutamate ligase [Albimonas donghaensis]